MRKRKRTCKATIVLGDHISKVWILCKERKEGLCCKDCKELMECHNPCSRVRLYREDSYSYDFSDFQCSFFLTRWEAIIKRLDNDEIREVKK